MDRNSLRPQIAERIRAWRREGDVDFDAIGSQVGVSKRTVQRWEAGATEPNVTDLVLLEQLHPGLVQALLSLVGG